uniref:SAM domain-containing protein n=1 Tax=Leersia perrieri TaxID=77586 RepID=A0A0D9W5Y0_9ORYZ
MASSASSSRHQVTITLGRSGQVVKRRAVSGIDNDDGMHFSGKKRSVRDRLGNNMVGSESFDGQQRNKRRQTETNALQHGDDDCQVGRDDLRLKLMKKGLSSNGGAEQNGVDLREKLSRKPKNLRRYDAGGHGPESRSRYDGRDKIPELRSRYGTRERIPEPRTSTRPSLIPSARSMDNLLKLDVSREPYSSWSAGDLMRHRSPEKHSSARRDVSPSRTYDHIHPMHSMPPVRSAGSSRPSGLIPRDTPDALRTQRYAGKSTVSIDTAQPANGVTPSATVLSTTPVMAEVPLTVTGLLNSLGLEKYVILFQAEEVDMTALSQMGDSDLKEIGIPMGPRKKILLAVAPYSKRRR